MGARVPAARCGYGCRVNIIERSARAVDRYQRDHRFVAFPFAVVKKFGDDDGGRLAGLIAYYGFFSLFPLLLVFVSVLGFVLSSHPHLRASLVDGALGQFPVIGNEIRSGAHVQGLHGNWWTIAIGGGTAIWAGLGVAQSAQFAMNIVWDVPRSRWPNFVFRRVRAVGVLALLGAMVVGSTLVSGYGSSGVLPAGLAFVGWLAALALNVALFTVAFRILTTEDLRFGDVLPGSVVGAVLWTIVQALGGYYLTHEIKNASDVYGAFALVIALLVWIALGAQVMLLAAEVNVVRRRHLWPRSLVQPPLTAGDERVYAAIVERARMRPELAVRVWYPRSREERRRRRDRGREKQPNEPAP